MLKNEAATFYYFSPLIEFIERLWDAYISSIVWSDWPIPQFSKLINLFIYADNVRRRHVLLVHLIWRESSKNRPKRPGSFWRWFYWRLTEAGDGWWRQRRGLSVSACVEWSVSGCSLQVTRGKTLHGLRAYDIPRFDVTLVQYTNQTRPQSATALGGLPLPLSKSNSPPPSLAFTRIQVPMYYMVCTEVSCFWCANIFEIAVIFMRF